MSRPLSAAMHKQSGPLIGHRDFAATAAQSPRLLSTPCLETRRAQAHTTSRVFERILLKGPGRRGRDGATAGVGMSQARSLHGNVCWIESLGVSEAAS